MFPPGYNSKEATARLARQFANPNLPGHTMYAEWQENEDVAEVRSKIYGRFDIAQQDLQMIAGTPDYVIPRLKRVMDVLRPGILSFWIDGPLPRADRLKCLQLLAADVIPALREYARKLEILDPFERKPGSVPLAASGRVEQVAWPELFASA
jgi:hypothetical protein